MEFLRKYWSMLVMAVMLVSSATTAQVQVSANAEDIKDIKEDVKKLEEQKTEQAVMKANQENIKDDLKEIKQLLREMKK